MSKANYTCNVKIKCKKTFHNKDNVVGKATQCHIVSDCTDIYRHTYHSCTCREHILHIIMLSVNFFCSISSYFGIYHKELYRVDILCENSTSAIPVSRGEGWVYSCLSSYAQLVHVQGGGSNLLIYHSRLSVFLIQLNFKL